MAPRDTVPSVIISVCQGRMCSLTCGGPAGRHVLFLRVRDGEAGSTYPEQCSPAPPVSDMGDALCTRRHDYGPKTGRGECGQARACRALSCSVCLRSTCPHAQVGRDGDSQPDSIWSDPRGRARRRASHRGRASPTLPRVPTPAGVGRDGDCSAAQCTVSCRSALWRRRRVSLYGERIYYVCYIVRDI